MTNTTVDTTHPAISVILATGTLADAADFLAECIRDGAWGDVADFAEAAECFGASDEVLRMCLRAMPTHAEAPDFG